MNNSTLDEQLTGRQREFDGRTTDRLRSTSGQLSEDRRIIVGDLSVRRLARAHDKTIDDNSITDKTIEDGFDLPFENEDEVAAKFRVIFVRTPCEERVVFRDAEYLGIAQVKNKKFGYVYRAHFWLVDFLSVGRIDFEKPMRGLLQITVKRWRNAGLPGPATVFGSISAVTANRQRQIIHIEPELKVAS